MSALGRTGQTSWALFIGALVGLWSAPVQAESCLLSPYHVGLTFPVSKVEARWTCPLQAIIDSSTTANKIGPMITSLSEPVYRYLLDRPPMAAALINRLDLGLYKAEERGTHRFWGDDGEGTSGIVELVYQDRTNRIYYLVGSHESTFLQITGKAAVFVRMNPVKDAQGEDAVETTLVAYTKLDSRMLAGLVLLIRPLVGSTVAQRLTQGVHTVNRLGQEMRQRPGRVLFEATDLPALPDDQVAFLRQALQGPSYSGSSSRSRSIKP